MQLHQLALATGTLWATGTAAAGIRVNGDAIVAAPVPRRQLQVTSLPSGVVTTDLGCFADARADRVFTKGLTRQSDLTPETCAQYCLDRGEYKYYALQWGQECWCARAGTDYARLGELDMSECDFPCTGDPDSLCGGYYAFQAFELGALDQPAGHLGCYTDAKSRLFAAPFKRTDDNTAETCKATCAGYAFYGLQYGQECFCGEADEDYTKYGTSDACGYRCSGDVLSTCGGWYAMDVFAMDDTTPPPAPVVTLPPVVGTPPTAPVVTLPPVVGTPPPAPVGTLPPVVGTPPPAPVVTLPPVVGTPPPAPVGTLPPVVGTPPPAPVVTLPPVVGTLPPVAVIGGSVLVDLVPCLFSSEAITEISAPELYTMSLFFKGYWSPKTEEYVVSATDTLTDLLVDSTDTTTPHGKCNAVYVGYQPSAAQAAELTAYSAQFKVRIVYFASALTHTDATYAAKLGIQTWFEAPLSTPDLIGLTALGGEEVSITQTGLQTDPNPSPGINLFIYPVIQVADVAEVEVLAQYTDASGIPYVSGPTGDSQNAAMLTYTGADGHEEMHVFFSVGWFDTGSVAWAHYFNEWATKGVFMGERRFYLGAVVDDLFLATPEFEYDGGLNEAAEEQRCTGADLSTILSLQQALNAQYPGSDIITEFAFNGGGIAEKVSSAVDGITYVPNYEDTMVTLKGTKWYEDGQVNVHDVNWLANNVPLMQADMDSGLWEANDELLAEVISHLDTPSTFFHQSHTLIHLSRDQLRDTDCFTEDTGNVQIALMTGIWDSDNYNWRSMVSPGITGLFNQYCLDSGAQNLMTCYPGDNTYDGTVDGTAILVNEANKFHSIYTTVDTNGYDGAQIVPRFATYVYFNCVTGTCLVNENEYIRRFVCGCTPLDPSEPDYTCTSTADECFDQDNVLDIQSFGSIDAIFEEEATTTTRNMLQGRRDKYMFHQANLIPASDVGGKSLLAYWYEVVMEEFSKHITFPVKSVKFDDLCTNFKLHEALDASSPYVTMALDETGAVTGFNYVSGSGAGLVPLTVPTASAASIPTTGLSIQDTETYGTDTTYYLKDDDANTVARVGTKPDASLLAQVPDVVTVTSAIATATESPAEVVENAEELAENEEANALVNGEQGLLDDQPLVDANIAAEAEIVEEQAEGAV